MQPELAPVEVADTTGLHQVARADAEVMRVWDAHHGEIFAFLVRTTRDTEVAEDLLQEAFLRLTREARADRMPDNARAWLYRVSGNLATSRGRRLGAAARGIARMGRPPTLLPSENLPEQGYLHREGRADLMRILADLDPAARAALLMASEGFSGAEIAAAIGRSEAATRTLLCRTRLRVRGRLESPEAAR